jgi:GNAT superfamily N-acetyltransferase
VAPEDERFLRTLFAQVRGPEFAPLGLPADALDQLLSMQFQAQAHSYRRAHPEARFDVVTVEGSPVGRLVVDRSGSAIHLIDIALLRAHQGRGIGTELVSALIEESLQSGCPVTLTVLRTNPALTLYRRLGFTEAGGDEVHLVLERAPAPLR